MENRWSEEAAAESVARYGERYGEELALRTYSSRLLGAEPGLVLHGGGNTSVKGSVTNRFGETVEVLYVKGSGLDLATIEPDGHVALDLDYVCRLRALSHISDDEIVDELRRRSLEPGAPAPSIEAPVHALIPDRFVDHTHADAILAITNQPSGAVKVQEALGGGVIVVPYVVPGFQLARAVAEAYEEDPEARAMVWMHHGIVTWGETARESYDLMIELVTRAEQYLDRSASTPIVVESPTPVEVAEERLGHVAPIVRGLLATRTSDADRPVRRVVLRPVVSRKVLDLLDFYGGRELAVSPPLTCDHLIRTRVLPAWVDSPDYEDEERLRGQIEETLRVYSKDYNAYLMRHAERMPDGVEPFLPVPRVVLLPGLGALCAGDDGREATITRDITERTFSALAMIAAAGESYEALPEEDLFDMEYRKLQHAKLEGTAPPPLAGTVALVTGAAGAIGSGICAKLLENGAHVAATDLAGDALDALVEQLGERFSGRVMGVTLDVTDEDSVAAGFDAVSRAWGGVDLLVINAGLAHVSTLQEMDAEQFRRVQRVNTEGTLLLLQRAAKHLKGQGTGGDIVLVSTKNVFSPGAQFGAYSATKAAAHQLARVASLELAEDDVRVNMVSPDAVFSHGERKSGLWAEVGPDRMRARGLDEDGLEEYYRNRNLLKARVTAEHVANGVLFFATRQTPTTGATLPIDGGLPDSTPR